MKGKLIGKLLENRKVVRTGCGLMAAVVLFSGGLYIYDSQNAEEWALPTVIEQDGDVVIADEDVPLAQAPTVKTTKKTKTTKKKVKLKKANTKTYTKKLKTKTKTTTKTQKKSDRTIKTVTKTTTATTEQYKKKQKFKTVVTKVTTETTVTTTMKATKATTTKPSTTKPSTTKPATQTGGTSEEVVKKTLDANTVIPKADANVRNAFIQLGFTIKVDSTVGYMGKFSATTKSITMRKEDHESIYHELGHFLMFMFVQNSANDGGAKGKAAYAAEKSLYTGFNNEYVNQDASEYMAESYRDYCTNPTKLQAERPQTYAVIKEAVAKVNDEWVAKIKSVYKW